MNGICVCVCALLLYIVKSYKVPNKKPPTKRINSFPIPWAPPHRLIRLHQHQTIAAATKSNTRKYCNSDNHKFVHERNATHKIALPWNSGVLLCIYMLWNVCKKYSARRDLHTHRTMAWIYSAHPKRVGGSLPLYYAPALVHTPFCWIGSHFTAKQQTKTWQR